MIIIRKKERHEFKPKEHDITNFWYWFTDQNSKYPNDLLVRRCLFCFRNKG